MPTRSQSRIDPCYGKDMARVTSKLQVTIPKAIADAYGIRPGEEIDWLAAGDSIRVLPPRQRTAGGLPRERRLDLFDRATERQRERETAAARRAGDERGWSREELYARGRAR